MADGTVPAAARRSLVVQEYTNSLLDPEAPMLGPVENGGTVIANTALLLCYKRTRAKLD